MTTIIPTDKTFTVTYEARKNGALGDFTPHSTTVMVRESSYSDDDIYRLARVKLYVDNLELRFPIGYVEIKGE